MHFVLIFVSLPFFFCLLFLWSISISMIGLAVKVHFSSAHPTVYIFYFKIVKNLRHFEFIFNISVKHAKAPEIINWHHNSFVIHWAKTGQVSIPDSCTSSRSYRGSTIWGHVQLAAVTKCDVVKPLDILGVKMRSSGVCLSLHIMQNAILWAAYVQTC